jgi:transcriptional regulator with XRE-family HTH domain
MRDDAAVWQALLRRKDLSVAELAGRLGITRQHAHRLLTDRRRVDSHRLDLERALALGEPSGEDPLYAVAELDADGELDLVPAGDAQPLFGDRAQATKVARELDAVSDGVCVVPVWPAYAWRTLVAFHAAWGAEPEPRKVFVVDATPDDELPLEAIVKEIRTGLEATLQMRAQAHDQALLGEVMARLSGYTAGRLPQ